MSDTALPRSAASHDVIPSAPHARGGRMIALIVVNLVFVVASLAFGVIALADPALLLPAGGTVSTGVQYYAAFYAVRAIPLALALVIVLLRIRPDSRNQGMLGALLLVAGVAQLGDAVIGVVWGTTAVYGGIVAAIVHIGSVVLLALWHRRWDPRRQA
jgi:cytochrome c biogenesis factor